MAWTDFFGRSALLSTAFSNARSEKPQKQTPPPAARPRRASRLVGALRAWAVGLLALGALSCDSSGPSAEAPEAPSSPSGLRAAAGREGSAAQEGISLEWSPPAAGEDLRYNVYRSTDSIGSVEGREPVNADPVRQASFTDEGARQWQPYHYRVTAVRGSGEQAAESGPSDPVTYTLPEVRYTVEAPDPQGPPQFGLPVSSIVYQTGDGTEDLLAGTVSFEESERVYLIDGADGSVRQRLRPPSLSPGEVFGFFGNDVGDLNGDGTTELIIASPGATAGGMSQAGRTHLLSGADGSVIWARRSPEPQEGGRFGGYRAAGDVNGDGVPDIIAPAPGESASGISEAGRTYLLDGTDGTVLDTLFSPDPQQEARFGFLISAPSAEGTSSETDFNRDGVPDAVASVRLRDVGGAEDAGRIYLFDGKSFREDLRLETIRTIESPNPESGGQFGENYRTLPDLNGDGVSELAVGALGETAAGQEDAGRVYIISGADGSVLRDLTSPSLEAGGLFGNTVVTGGQVAVGDVTGDGIPELAIQGAETVGGYFRAGRIYLFDGARLLEGGSPEEAVLRRFVSPRPEQEGFFGTGIQILPEEGLLVAGANGESSAGTDDAGRIYAFPLP